MIYGIDLSKHNGKVDFNQVKKAGVKFVILRCGYASLSNRTNLYKDEKFEEYYKGAKAAGLGVGTYFYSRCNSDATGLAEAKYIYSLIKDKQFDYPVWLDVEDLNTFKSTTKEKMTSAIITCLEYLEKQKIYCGIYTGKYFLRDYMVESKLKPYDKWIAQWGTKCTYEGGFGMWQFGGETNKLKPVKVAGVSSACCDQNYAYIDYPTVIKKAGLNGYNTTGTKVQKYTTTDNLNVRSGRGTKFKILTTLKKGTSVEVSAVEDNWGYVRQYNGYICMDYVK